MRPRYLILFGAVEERQLAKLKAALSVALPCYHRAGTLHLFAGRDTPVLLLPGSEGAVVGTLFDRTAGRRVSAVSMGVDHAVASTRGAQLIERHWGSYAAFWSDPARGLQLVRDPAGGVPAYWRDDGRSVMVTSDVELAVAAGMLRSEVAWDRLSEALLFPDLPSRTSMLIGLADTIPGMVHTLRSAASDELLLWDPARFARRAAADAPAADHARRVRDAVDAAVTGWRDCFDTVALELSGGLDSSIVAAALARTDRSWEALTFVTRGADGDERRYARAVADRFGVTLHDVLPNEAISQQPTYRRLTIRPRGTAFLAPLDRLMTAAADNVGAQAVFTGMGGDHIFYATRSTAPVLDAWAVGGLAHARRTAFDVARLCGAPLSEVYGAALRRAWTHRRSRPWQADMRYVAAGSRREPPGHPWMIAARDALHGTRARTAALLRLLGMLDGVDRMATRNMVSPIVAQPVLEACLAVPTWLCVAGGRDRALARDAFADQLPELVIRRRGKGRVDSLVVGTFESDRHSARELLLGGLLAGAGLLDRGALERDLARPGSDREPFQDRIMQIVDAELWARAIANAGTACPSLP